LKAIHSDNGTEFRNASFDEFCLQHGIDQQFSTPRVAQQNRVMERKNCTLVEMARTMLNEHGTPMRFWADAISTACYVSNRIFLRSILLLTPLSFDLVESLQSLTSDAFEPMLLALLVISLIESSCARFCT
jgi:transposase InsO family protein